MLCDIELGLSLLSEVLLWKWRGKFVFWFIILWYGIFLLCFIDFVYNLLLVRELRECLGLIEINFVFFLVIYFFKLSGEFCILVFLFNVIKWFFWFVIKFFLFFSWCNCFFSLLICLLEFVIFFVLILFFKSYIK